MPTSGRSTDLVARAEQVIPGGINSTSRTQLLETRGGDPVCIDRADGARLVDVNGNEYVDYLNAWGPVFLGHSDEDVNTAVTEAMEQRDLTGVSTSELEVQAAEAVLNNFEYADKVQFGTTGSEVVTHAIRAARAITGRTKIIKFQGHYHGWYDPVALNYLSKPENLDSRDPISTGIPPASQADTLVLPFNDPAAVKETVADNEGEIAAILLEPVAHDMGCIPPVDGYLQELRRICDENGILLVFDEIITAFRHTMGGVQDIEKVAPDFTTLAKALANGYQVSALAGKDEYMDRFTTARRGGGVYFAGTYNAHTSAMAAVVETIRQMEERDVHDRIDEVRTRIVDALEDHCEDLGLDTRIRAYGGVFGTYFGGGRMRNYRELLEFDAEMFEAYRWNMFERGVLMVPKFPRANFLNASLTDEQVRTTTEAAAESLRSVGR